MATEVKCPSCGFGFPIEEVMAEEYKKELRVKMQEYTTQKEEEYRKKENEFNTKQREQQQQFEERLVTEKKQLQLVLEENLRKSIASDFENQMLMLQNNVKESEEKLRASRQKELEFLRMYLMLNLKRCYMHLRLEHIIIEI